ncbi:MAG TPA: hypothetical protein VGU01_08425 [Sphingomicrobium sp.]|nr:hypothetical protein [Sphingomicrobium sp.]
MGQHELIAAALAGAAAPLGAAQSSARVASLAGRPDPNTVLFFEERLANPAVGPTAER